MSDNPAKAQRRAPFSHRMAIWFFTFLLTVLVYWLLGFIMQDIGTLQGPDFAEIERRHVDQELVAQREALQRDEQKASRDIKEQEEKRNALGQSTQSLQKTIGQLIELQKLQTEKDVVLSETQQETFANSMNTFLANQERDQAITRAIAGLIDAKAELEADRRKVEAQLDVQRKPALEEYRQRVKKHNLRKATYKLCVLIPLLVVSSMLVVFKRGAALFPVFLAVSVATLIKVSQVIHEHFPTKWFKYILLVVFIAAVYRILVYFIRAVRSPKTSALVKQYRDAYQRFLCPVCEYPIRRGPMRFLFWTRRSVKKLRLPPGGEADHGSYVCPSCSTPLFEECAACHKTRCSLLPYCEHCGAETDIGGRPGRVSPLHSP